MGCFSDKSNLTNNISQNDDFENYPEPNEITFDIVFLKLNWKIKPNICYFQKIDEETLEKQDILNMESLLQISQMEEMKLVPQLYETKNALFYIFCSEGVIITGNIAKVNYYFSINNNNLIKFCIVDITSIIMTGSEYNSIREIKRQSRFFFELNLKEINLTNRNELINLGKNEELSDTEVDLDDEHLEELQKNKYEQHIYTSDYENENEKDDEQEFEYEMNENEKEISKISIDKMVNKNTKENNKEKNNMDYIETNANEVNKNEEKEEDEIDENKNEGEDPDNLQAVNGYDIRNNCLIISLDTMTEEINKELKKHFFITTLRDESPYLYKSFHNQDEENKKNKEKEKGRTKSQLQQQQQMQTNSEEEIIEHINNDYIQIYKRNVIPYEKRTSQHKINKIIFKDCNFSNESLCYLKEFFMMLSCYPDLLKIAIYHNDMESDFTGWKYFRQLVRDNFNIRWVSFKGAGLNDKLFADIIMGMTLKRIRYLNISKNKITNKGLYFLNKFLMKNQTLLILDLSNNQNVTSEGIKSITNALKMHPNINKLDLSNMRIKGSGHYISNFIRDNKCLKSLYLKNCMLEKPDIEQFPTVFARKDCQIQDLDISLNSSVGEDGLKEIGKLITNNKSLISIGLDGMNLSMNNYMPVFQGILKNKTIKCYSLNMNPGLPLKGMLNFFLKNPYVKGISIIPWDYTKDKTKKFSDSQLQLFERFHKKAPDVVINGIEFN